MKIFTYLKYVITPIDSGGKDHMLSQCLVNVESMFSQCLVQHNPKPFLRRVSMVLLMVLGMSGSAFGQTYNNGTWYSLYDDKEYKNTDHTYNVYAPTNGKLTFSWKKDGWFVGYPGLDIYVYEYVRPDASRKQVCDVHSAVTSRTGYDSYVTTGSSNISISTDISKLEFTIGGTLNRYYRYVRVPMAKHIRLKSTSKTNNADLFGTTSQTFKAFEDTEWGTTNSSSKTVEFRSFLTNGDIKITCDKPEIFRLGNADNTSGITYTTGANTFACEATVTDAKKTSAYNFKVYFCPAEAKDYSATITITDGTSTATVKVSGKGIKRNQTIQDFSTAAATHNTTDVVTFAAYTTDNTTAARNNRTVTYSSNNTSVATVDASGNVTIKTSGTVTFTAAVAADAQYNASSKSVTWTINKVTPIVTWPIISSGLKYNESCAIGDKVTDHWTGGSAEDDKHNSVEGTFICDADLVPANTNYMVLFNPTNTNWYNSISTTLSGVVAKADQTITWDLAESVEYATGTEMGATASSGLGVTYTSSNDEWGYINESGRLVVVEPNKTITITAHQAGDDNWNPAPDVTKTFITLGANPNQLTEVTASGITYGQTLSASALSGNVLLNGVVIPGTLEWVDPMIMPNAGTANHMVLFTPDNTAACNPVYFEVPVAVAKADPVIIWNIGNILREDVRYSHFVESNNREVPLNYSTNFSLLNITDGVLTTGEVAAKQTGLTITVSQAETANYNAISVTKTVALYPKAKICLPIDLSPSNPNAAEDYADAEVAQDENVTWCNTDDDGYKENYIAHFDVTYTQRKGIAMGSWEAGLTGLSWKALVDLIGTGRFDYTPKYVDLFFSGIPNTISFDVESQEVTSSPPSKTWNATQKNWSLYVSADGENFGSAVAMRTGDGKMSYTFKDADVNVRYVRIKYTGNFTGFVKNLVITQKKYLRSDKSSLTFGTEANPLQEPQAITLSYSSLGICGRSEEDAITITSSNPAFYVDEEIITENVGIEQSGSYTLRVRCNEINQTGTLTFTSNDGTTLAIPVTSTNPAITTAATDIFQTGTEHTPVAGTAYRTRRTLFTSDMIEGLFHSSTPLFDTLYIYGVSESAADTREWEYSPAKGYKVPVVNAGNIYTPCFVYKKEDAQYTYVRTFDASATTLDVADAKTRVLVGYRPQGPAANAVQLNAGAAISLNSTEIVATDAAITVSGNATVAARGANIVSSENKAAVQLSGTTTLAIADTWNDGETSAVLALRPATNYPSIDLGGAAGRVDINGTQLELHNATSMAIAHMNGTVEKFDGEVHINDGSVGGEAILGMPKRTFIDGGTFNDGTVAAYTLKGIAKRPRNSRGEMLARQTMPQTALEENYSWYGQKHLTWDGAAKVNPMLMDDEVWIFEGNAGEEHTAVGSWNKGALPGEDDDVLINAPMMVSGGELKVRSLTINWEDKGRGIPAVTVAPDGGLTVGEGGIDALKVTSPVDNLALKAGTTGATKGQTGFLRIHPESAEPMPQATVELYSIGYYDKTSDEENIAAWQYVGTPIDFKGALAKTVFTRSWIYSYNESTDSWVNNRAKLVMQPFVGYSTTQYDSEDGKLLAYKGELINNAEHTIDLSYTASNGYNVVANSFAAPIDITQMRSSDFVNVEPTIYLFHTGTHKQAEDNIGTEGSNAGQFISIAIGTAAEMATLFEDDDIPTTIAPMQGFGIYASGAGGQVNLDYSRLVWDANYAEHPNKPLRVAKRQEEETENNEHAEITGALKIAISADGRTDKCYLLESESYDAIYEAGYDASKKMSGSFNVYTIAEEKQLAVNATNSIDGTRVGVRTGEETTYTMKFSHINSEKPLTLWDKEANFKVLISEDVEYTFNAVPNSEITERFQIVAANIPTVTTGVEEAESEATVQKFIKDNQLYILKNGVLYNATGAVVRK